MVDRLAPITARLDRLSRALDPSSSSVRTMGAAVQAPVEAELELVARDVFGSDLRPYHRERKVAGVEQTTSAATGRTSITFRLRPAGAWVVAERGARPHIIGDDRRLVYIARAQRPVRGPVRHPGVAGKRAVSRARERATRVARPAVVDGFRDIVRSTGG